MFVKENPDRKKKTVNVVIKWEIGLFIFVQYPCTNKNDLFGVDIY